MRVSLASPPAQPARPGLMYSPGFSVPAADVDTRYQPLPENRRPAWYGCYRPRDIDYFLAGAGDVQFDVFKFENPWMFNPASAPPFRFPSDAVPFADKIAALDAELPAWAK